MAFDFTMQSATTLVSGGDWHGFYRTPTKADDQNVVTITHRTVRLLPSSRAVSNKRYGCPRTKMVRICFRLLVETWLE